MSSHRRLRFSKKQRLNQRRDFERVRGAKAIQGRFFKVGYLQDPAMEQSRLGIITTRKFGPAVARSRIRRIVREFFRVHHGAFVSRGDFVVIPKRSADGADGEALRAELRKLFLNAGFFSAPASPERGPNPT